MVTLYEITITPFIKNLQTLSKLLEKGEDFTKQDGSKVTVQELTDAKLIEDMGGLIFQIQRVTDTAKGLAQRIGGIEPVVLEDNQTTYAELYTRIQATIDILEKVKPEHINAQEDAEVVMKMRSGELKFTGKDFVNKYAILNFYFHFVTAYDILRMKGVPVGKQNYLGNFA